MWAAREAGLPAVSSDTALAATEKRDPGLGSSAILSLVHDSDDAQGVKESPNEFCTLT